MFCDNILNAWTLASLWNYNLYDTLIQISTFCLQVDAFQEYGTIPYYTAYL